MNPQNWKRNIRTMGKAFVVTIVIAFLCYRSVWAGLLFPIVFLFFYKQEKQAESEKQTEQMQQAFLHALKVLNDSLQAGLSMENSWREVENELKILYGETASLYVEVKEMNRRVVHNIPVEKLFLEIAHKYQIEEMMQFAQLLEYGKRSGSNWKKIIQTSVTRMSEKFEARQQIDLMLAEKKMEQQIMNVMPLLVLAYLQVSAWDYMSVLYHNWFGCICMSVFLVMYVIALIISAKIMRIEV